MLPGHKAVAHRCFRKQRRQFLLFPVIPQQHAAVAGIPVLVQTDLAHLHAALFHETAQKAQPVKLSHHLRRHIDLAVRHFQGLGHVTYDEHGIFQHGIACAHCFFRRHPLAQQFGNRLVQQAPLMLHLLFNTPGKMLILG